MENPTIFGKIIRGEVPCTKVYEDERVLVFHDIHPAAPVHMLVIPKKYVVSLMEMKSEDAELLGYMLLVANKVAMEAGLRGYKVHMNVGKAGGQVVEHVHVHVLGGWKEGEEVAHV